MALYTYPVDLAAGPGFDLGVTSSIALAVQGGSGLLMPAAWTAKCSLIEPGNDLTPPMGGRMQRISRLGARWSVTFSSLPALGDVAARALIALRAQARANGLTMVFLWPQAAFAGGVGAPAINGGGQLGTVLACNGLASGVTLPAGSFFSFAAGGRTWLHCLTAPATADGSGSASLAIAPMLRTATSGGETLGFAAPAIEGFIQGQSEDWTLQQLSWVGLPAFTVVESGATGVTAPAPATIITEAGAAMLTEGGAQIGAETPPPVVGVISETGANILTETGARIAEET